MNKNPVNSVFDNLDEKVNLAIKKALEKHQKLGESVVVYQDGEIKTFTGEEIKTLLDQNKE
jgi:20S proteasome alpha/beta subunit